MDDEAKPYLLTEASGLTGLSVDALRKRIERKKLRGSRSNEDGQWRVWLTSKDVETAQSGRAVDTQPDESRTIKAMEGEAATLRETLNRERERADQAEARASRAEAEREAAKVAAASAEGRVEGLRLALEEARRPFWRRWLG